MENESTKEIGPAKEILAVLQSMPVGVTLTRDCLVIKIPTDGTVEGVESSLEAYRQLYGEIREIEKTIAYCYAKPWDGLPLWHNALIPALMPSGLNNPPFEKEVPNA